MSYFANNKEINLLHPEAQKIFRNLIESVKAGIYMADSKGKLFFVNQTFVDILGYNNKQEVLGLDLVQVLYTDLEKRNVFLKTMEKVGFVRDDGVKIMRKDGSMVNVSTTSHVIRNEKNEVIGFEGIIQDITEKKELEDNLKIEKFKLEQILSFEEKIRSIHKFDELVNFIVEKTTQILNAARCSLMLVEEGTQELSIKAAIGLDKEVMKNTRVKLGEPIAGLVAQEEDPVLVKNIEYDQRFKRGNKPYYRGRSFMSAAIRQDHKLIGVVNVSDKNPQNSDNFNELDLKILSTIVRQAAGIIENAKLYNELEYLSKMDPLTDLYNYRSFVKSLDQEINRLKRYPGSLSLLMIDVDDFKTYNDTHGHLEGDILLKKLSDVFKQHLRSVDTICRYGGDEFAVILPGTDSQQAKLVAEKLRKNVEEVPFKDKITLSIGISDYQSHLSRFDLTRLADKALYQAKREGKNRIGIY